MTRALSVPETHNRNIRTTESSSFHFILKIASKKEDHLYWTFVYYYDSDSKFSEILKAYRLVKIKEYEWLFKSIWLRNEWKSHTRGELINRHSSFDLDKQIGRER